MAHDEPIPANLALGAALRLAWMTSGIDTPETRKRWLAWKAWKIDNPSLTLGARVLSDQWERA